ncbi:hypothetical protein PN499_17780 [Kamptonema animale CS-326]|jgi:hypothetical protein|uniref:hypothetical protein n=1 Tax=Kamptonema animale TaxID=92934 RepID=UPI002330B91B|nr:hypothetical protein [Kamptonema animale]MDB9513044.1 hypothetical protein [Kamptonema animale CS-326]
MKHYLLLLLALHKVRLLRLKSIIPDSDIDILIVLKNSFSYSQESDRISIFIADLCLEYNVLISCAFATDEQFHHYNNAFFRNIRQEGLAI